MRSTTIHSSAPSIKSRSLARIPLSRKASPSWQSSSSSSSSSSASGVSVSRARRPRESTTNGHAFVCFFFFANLIDAEIANVTGRQKEGELRTETDLERKRPHRPGSRGGWPDAGQSHAGETARERERATCVCVRVHAVLLGRTHGAHAIPGPPPHPLIVPRAGYYCASTAKGGAAGSKGRQATARVRLCNVLCMEDEEEVVVVSRCHSLTVRRPSLGVTAGLCLLGGGVGQPQHRRRRRRERHIAWATMEGGRGVFRAAIQLLLRAACNPRKAGGRAGSKQHPINHHCHGPSIPASACMRA